MASNPMCPASMWEVWGALNPLPSEQPPVPTAACRLPIVQGPCQKLVMRWAFDAAQGKCITFSYGGCKGNGNQFYSEKECKEYCGAPPLAGTPTLPAPCPHRTALCRGSRGSSLHHLLSCSGLGLGVLGLPGMGTGLSWIRDGSWDGSVLDLDGFRMGLSWVQGKSGMGLSWVRDGSGMVLCCAWDGSVLGRGL